MCVIIHKPKDETLSEDILWQCFTKNKDGAGLLVNGRHCEKGFFKFWGLLKQVQKYQNEDLIVHCRHATSGPINNRFCHPFKTPLGFLFHNGVIKGLGNNQVSDTYRLSLILNDPRTLNVLSEKTGSRFALVSENKIQKFGEWYELNGLSFSNLRWQEVKIPKNSCWYCNQPVLNHKVFCTNCGMERW